MTDKNVILWFRQDLRLHDNEALFEAVNSGNKIIPIYVFDERLFENKTPLGFRKTDKFRAQFILESVQDLRNNIRALGSELYVRYGKPEEVIYDIAREHKTNWVFCNRERTQEEKDVQDTLEARLWTIGQEIRFSRGKMLYYTSDLPFPVTHTPDHFLTFRKEVERFVQVRKPLPTESMLADIECMAMDAGSIPSLKDLGYENAEESVQSIRGGESVGIELLQMLESKEESCLSPYLSQGCLSPKMLYHFCEDNTSNDKQKKELFNKLLLRDYYRLMGKKHGNKIFQQGGTYGLPETKIDDKRILFDLWKDSKTGIPLIDAAMLKLKKTGLIATDLRILCAQYLVEYLKVNWRYGAQYFESLLVDYDPCSNWGNWNNIAGVGCDGKKDHHMNVEATAKKIDPHGDFVKKWLPTLSNLPENYIHCPQSLSGDQAESLGFILERDYYKKLDT